MTHDLSKLSAPPHQSSNSDRYIQGLMWTEFAISSSQRNEFVVGWRNIQYSSSMLTLLRCEWWGWLKVSIYYQILQPLQVNLLSVSLHRRVGRGTQFDTEWWWRVVVFVVVTSSILLLPNHISVMIFRGGGGFGGTAALIDSQNQKTGIILWPKINDTPIN